MPGEEKSVVIPRAIPANQNQNVNHPTVPSKSRVKFIKILNDLRKDKRSKTLEDLGYKLNSPLDDNNNHYMYVNDKYKIDIAVILLFDFRTSQLVSPQGLKTAQNTLKKCCSLKL